MLLGVKVGVGSSDLHYNDVMSHPGVLLEVMYTRQYV